MTMHGDKDYIPYWHSMREPLISRSRSVELELELEREMHHNIVDIDNAGQG